MSLFYHPWVVQAAVFGVIAIVVWFIVDFFGRGRSRSEERLEDYTDPQARKRREWDPMLERLREWIPALEGERSPEAQVFRERLKSIESLVAMVDSMAESFLKGGMVQKLGLKVLVASAARKRAKLKAGRRP